MATRIDNIDELPRAPESSNRIRTSSTPPSAFQSTINSANRARGKIDRSTGFVPSRRPGPSNFSNGLGDEFFRQSFLEANENVDRAVDMTIR